MKERIRLAVLVLLVLSATQSVFADSTLKPELGTSLVISPDYNDTLKEAYPHASVSGIGGWLGLHLGLRFRPVEQIIITPRIGFIFNYVTSLGTADSFVNTIIQPSLSAKLLFTTGSSFYVEGIASHNTVNTGSDAFDVEGGVGYAAFLGYQWDGGFDVGLGYSIIPTDVTIGNHVEDKNFGGVEIKFSGAF
jgi:hypothetical protein